jgi:hypothetical protein
VGNIFRFTSELTSDVRTAVAHLPGRRPLCFTYRDPYNRLKDSTGIQIGFSAPLPCGGELERGVQSGGTDMKARSQLTSCNLLRSLLLHPSHNSCRLSCCPVVTVKYKFPPPPQPQHKLSCDLCVFVSYEQ